MISSVISGLPASSRTAIRIGPAFRTRTATWLVGSGIDEDTTLSERLVNHRAWDIAPFVDVASADDDVEGNFKTAQLTTQTSRLGSAFRDLAGLNDEQVEVAVRRASPRAREPKRITRAPGAALASRLPTSSINLSFVMRTS